MDTVFLLNMLAFSRSLQPLAHLRHFAGYQPVLKLEALNPRVVRARRTFTQGLQQRYQEI